MEVNFLKIAPIFCLQILTNVAPDVNLKTDICREFFRNGFLVLSRGIKFTVEAMLNVSHVNESTFLVCSYPEYFFFPKTYARVLF